MLMNKRAVSAQDVYENERTSQGLSRVSSEYATIPSDIQNRLQSMSWRIRANVNRGYKTGGPYSAAALHADDDASFCSAADTLQGVKKHYTQWGRVASVPNGALRGYTAAHAPREPELMSRWSSDTDTANLSFGSSVPSISLKRGVGEDDSDAVLANAFADDSGEGMNGSLLSIQNENAFEAQSISDRPMRPLPRQGIRPTASLPPLREISSNSSPVHMSDEPMGENYGEVNFSAYAACTEGF